MLRLWILHTYVSYHKHIVFDACNYITYGSEDYELVMLIILSFLNVAINNKHRFIFGFQCSYEIFYMVYINYRYVIITHVKIDR